MKLGEFEIDDQDDKAEDIGLFVLNRIPVGVTKVRVEIHSLDNPPWPTERPEGWGVGWWCEVSGRQAGICRRFYGDPSAFHAEIVFPFDGYWVAGCLITGYMNSLVTSYGPKVEIPR